MVADELARLNSVKENKLRLLENDFRGITSFTQWVQANSARFQGRVYGPVLLEVSVQDPQHAKYLEQQMRSACTALDAPCDPL